MCCGSRGTPYCFHSLSELWILQLSILCPKTRQPVLQTYISFSVNDLVLSPVQSIIPQNSKNKSIYRRKSCKPWECLVVPIPLLSAILPACSLRRRLFEWVKLNRVSGCSVWGRVASRHQFANVNNIGYVQMTKKLRSIWRYSPVWE